MTDLGREKHSKSIDVPLARLPIVLFILTRQNGDVSG